MTDEEIKIAMTKVLWSGRQLSTVVLHSMARTCGILPPDHSEDAERPYTATESATEAQEGSYVGTGHGWATTNGEGG